MFQNLIPSTLSRAILATFLFITAALPSQALQSGDFTYTSTGSAIIITVYTGAGGAVTIPSSISGLPVTIIGQNAFYNKTGLTSMTIPNSVTSIGSQAFIGCTNLTSVTIGSGVTNIGDYAFDSCSGLTSLVVDAANPSYSSFAGVLFNKNQTTLIQYPAGKIGSYTIPNSVTSIGDQAFNGCTNLTSVTIPSGVTSISIGREAFSYCSGLTSVTIGSGVTSISIGAVAFWYCSGLTSVTIPNSVTSISIDGGAFFQCTLLGSMTITSDVTSIKSGTFYGCASLGSVTIPNSVTSIESSAFYGCTGLNNVTIPNSVTSIESSAFSFCTSLNNVTIPSGVTSINDRTFLGCRSLTNVTIGSGVTSIAEYAFAGCSGLSSVTIPSSVTSIGDSAFANCTGLTSVYFQGNAPTAADRPFYDTSATVYYRAGTTGWGSTFDGRPTAQVLEVPTITTQPVNVTTLQGTKATFTVTAIGASGYQWQKNSVNIPLATTATLNLSNVQQADATNYTVIVSSLAGDVTSNTATLTVLPDSDLDGLSDAAEAGYGTNPINADSDGDGLTDRAEIQVYLTNALAKDTDGDGFEDGFEVSTGFNPTQASSSPDSASTIGNAVGFRFNAGLGFSYRIEDSTDLQIWTTLESPIIGAGSVVTRFYFTEGQPKRYFRVKKNP